ncbi:PREDICTED: uncharacterized protein LOC108382510, partial [Rhagoletis zephyria]|uniref:uncharacterized protein LOC108382510 n=1 Tax=Rhagoletis zephyria TaxID=28612 RepID=UPI0008115D53
MLKIEFELKEIKGSGWTFLSTKFLTISINEYKPLTGSSYIELPKWIQSKKAVINVKNDDQECFKWAILSFENKLNFRGISFPTSINQISKYEEQNDLVINVYH